MSGHILLLSGPSGAGKSTLINKLIKEFKDEIYFSVSYTTRSPRVGEVDGINYHFITQKDFENNIKNDEFLEWARVHEHYYGSSKTHTIKALKNNKIVIFDIDVQGFMQIRKKLKKDLTSVFVTTLNKNILNTRLSNRCTDTKSTIQNRLKNAIIEMKFLHFYNHLIINDNIDKSYNELKNIYMSLRTIIKKDKDLINFKKQWRKD